MVTLHIEHPITNYSTRRSAFDAFADARRGAGVVAERVACSVEQPPYIVIGLDFESTDEAAAFRDFLTTSVWASSALSPALSGRPLTAIFELAHP
ncbi:MAG TPA: hypothetical protein VGC84_03085 [Ilumatobacteraceae bacterium]